MPNVPRGPSGPRRPGRLRLTPVRSRQSLALDLSVEPRTGAGLPPFQGWSDFYSSFASRFGKGQHITLVGGTGSGKTTLARECILLRNYVAVAATKIRDDSLYAPLEAQGFVTVPTFDPDWEELPRQIVAPPLRDVTIGARQEQREAFADMLGEIWQTGNWTIFADEIRYLTDSLKLGTDVETLWLQGRSLGVSVVAGTQRPVGIPLEAFSQASHLFLFRENDQRNIDRMAEFVAGDKAIAKYTIPRLARYEALYIERETGLMARTKVET